METVPVFVLVQSEHQRGLGGESHCPHSGFVWANVKSRQQVLNELFQQLVIVVRLVIRVLVPDAA